MKSAKKEKRSKPAGPTKERERALVPFMPEKSSFFDGQYGVPVEKWDDVSEDLVQAQARLHKLLPTPRPARRDPYNVQYDAPKLKKVKVKKERPTVNEFQASTSAAAGEDRRTAKEAARSRRKEGNALANKQRKAKRARVE